MADTGGPVVADQRLYLTRDRTRVVPDGDPEARSLFCTPGSTIPREQAARYGLLAAPGPAPDVEEAAEADREPEAPKQRTAQARPRTARTKPRTAAGGKSDDGEK